MLPKIASTDKPFFPTLAKTLTRPLFTVSIEPGGRASSITFGSIPSRYTNNIAYTPIVAYTGAWTAKVTSYSFGSQHSNAAFDAFIDTTTSELSLPDDIVDLYFLQLGSINFILSKNRYVHKCDTVLPDISISIGQYSTTIPGAYLTGPEVMGHEGCMYKHFFLILSTCAL